MTLKRMDNVLIVVDDLEATEAFFIELGLELEGETTVEGPSIGKLIGLEDVRATLAMMRTPDGQGVELDKFHTPKAIRSGPVDAPVNTLGLRRLMFSVDDIDSVGAHARPRSRAHRRDAVRGHLPPRLHPRARGHHRRACRAAWLMRARHRTPPSPHRSGCTMSTPPTAPGIERGELAGMLAAGDRVQILDVRRAPAFEQNPVLLPGALRVPPDTLGAWAASATGARSVPVVVYCVYGHEVSQSAATELQGLGFAARFLQGGLSEWQASGGVTDPGGA